MWILTIEPSYNEGSSKKKKIIIKRYYVKCHLVDIYGFIDSFKKYLLKNCCAAGLKAMGTQRWIKKTKKISAFIEFSFSRMRQSTNTRNE